MLDKHRRIRGDTLHPGIDRVPVSPLKNMHHLRKKGKEEEEGTDTDMPPAKEVVIIFQAMGMHVFYG
ncbi:hypothetical protein [Desulfoluna spongiiphila]|uniref:hypothetical protein n=1 Tax=Desulfoluna spongiiphila TaxID=419481 RepID=UPI00125EB61B|nr:hypothetical protein [Desulfoluna spongiiphila]